MPTEDCQQRTDKRVQAPLRDSKCGSQKPKWTLKYHSIYRQCNVHTLSVKTSTMGVLCKANNFGTLLLLNIQTVLRSAVFHSFLWQTSILNSKQDYVRGFGLVTVLILYILTQSTWSSRIHWFRSSPALLSLRISLLDRWCTCHCHIILCASYFRLLAFLSSLIACLMWS